MKVLVVSEEPRPLSALVNFLSHSKLEAEGMNLQDFKNLLSKGINYFEAVRAVVFDRIYLSPTLFPVNYKNIDYFFITNDFEKVESIMESDFDFTYRCYFWPLNYSLLADDIKSITRLKEYMDFGKLELNGVDLDLNRRSLRTDQNEVNLRNKEFELLLYLAKNKGKLLSRINILENVWDMNSNVLTNTVDVHVSKLRKILKEKFGLSNLIRTVPCSGYILV